MSSRTKSKKCVKGFPCGYACISRTKQCWANLSSSEGRMAETFSQFVNRLVGIGNDKESSLGNTISNISNISKKELSELFKDSKYLEDIEYLEYAKMSIRNYNIINGEKVRYDVYGKDSTDPYVEDFIYESALLKGNLESSFMKDNVNIDKKILDLIDYEKMSKNLPIDPENLKVLLKGPITEIQWETHEPLINAEEKLQAALEARKLWKEIILPRLKEGEILVNNPLGGPLGARAKSYSRQGFSDVDIFGNQYAVVKNGKLIPFEVFPPIKNYPKEGLTQEEFNKKANYN